MSEGVQDLSLHWRMPPGLEAEQRTYSVSCALISESPLCSPFFDSFLISPGRGRLTLGTINRRPRPGLRCSITKTPYWIALWQIRSGRMDFSVCDLYGQSSNCEMEP